MKKGMSIMATSRSAFCGVPRERVAPRCGEAAAEAQPKHKSKWAPWLIGLVALGALWALIARERKRKAAPAAPPVSLPIASPAAPTPGSPMQAPRPQPSPIEGRPLTPTDHFAPGQYYEADASMVQQAREAGKPFALMYYLPTCGFCVQALPQFEAAAHAQDQVPFLGVHARHAPPQIGRWPTVQLVERESAVDSPHPNTRDGFVQLARDHHRILPF